MMNAAEIKKCGRDEMFKKNKKWKHIMNVINMMNRCNMCITIKLKNMQKKVTIMNDKH